MKTLTIRLGKEQLSELLTEARHGDIIVLTDGERRISVHAVDLDLEEDTPELEAELLKAVNGPHAPLLESELREIADRALNEQRGHAK